MWDYFRRERERERESKSHSKTNLLFEGPIIRIDYSIEAEIIDYEMVFITIEIILKMCLKK